MLNLVNFSHPLPASREDVIALLGDDYNVFSVHVQLDLKKNPLQFQVISLVDQAIAAVGGNIRNIDVIVLPGLAEAASLIVVEFGGRGYIPNVLRLAKDDSLPPRFLGQELIKGLYRRLFWKGE